MRIRKRQAHLPLSALSPAPLSDPLSSRSYLVQLRSTHDDDKADGPTSSQPSDRPNRPSQPLGPDTEARDSSDSAAAQEESETKRDFPELLLLLQEEEEDGGEKKKRKKGNDSSALARYPSGSLANSSPSHQAERWCEGERAFPLKKRRGSLGETGMLDVKDSGGKKMKSAKSGNARTSKKDARRDDIDKGGDVEFEEGRGQGGGEDKKVLVSIESSGAKKKGRGGALMEGSRCSRVNGRGWRCCQQTLVGYSLCEHHLGKGRLRSMTSVRSKSKRPNLPPPARADELLLEERAPDSLPKAEGPEDGDEEDEGDIEEKTAVKKKVKLGMVKARSMSSLLSQASSAAATAGSPR
ncbi:Growth-regulating factor [Psidium guajava]|nr:Growth-regulating factor [Psidium guajava]